jgi:hypothetical protein
MAEILGFPKPKLAERMCVELGCWNQATRFIELAMMEPNHFTGEIEPVPGSERIFKFFCSEHAPQDAELL